MIKKVIFILVVLSLVGVLGCSITSRTTSPPATANVKPVREANIGKLWMMRQMEITVEDEIPLTLILKEGDRVDGYFYLEKGDNIGFSISGNSLIYTSKPPDTETTHVTSDRFSFTASQSQGIAYILTLNASANVSGKKGGATVFMEIIYPSTGSLSIPIGTK